jgi:hypothetical protein
MVVGVRLSKGTMTAKTCSAGKDART